MSIRSLPIFRNVARKDLLCLKQLELNTFSRFPSRRMAVAAPKPGVTLMNRRNDRELPPVVSPWRPWLLTAPIFLVVITISALGIFNYQKQNSSVVAATLYALRTSEVGRRELGDEIYFRDMWPWIWGKLDQLHGRIDISYGVKGTKSSGVMRFKSVRKTRMGFFETQEWSLQTEDGRTLQLLDEGREDPLGKVGEGGGSPY